MGVASPLRHGSNGARPNSCSCSLWRRNTGCTGSSSSTLSGRTFRPTRAPPTSARLLITRGRRSARRRRSSFAGARSAFGRTPELAVDVERFETEGELALRTGVPEACAAVAGTYRGELLPDQRYQDWAAERCRAVRALYLQLLRRAGLWEQVVGEAPTDEPAHRALMHMYADAGNRSAAVEQYDRLAAALAG